MLLLVAFMHVLNPQSRFGFDVFEEMVVGMNQDVAVFVKLPTIGLLFIVKLLSASNEDHSGNTWADTKQSESILRGFPICHGFVVGQPLTPIQDLLNPVVQLGAHAAIGLEHFRRGAFKLYGIPVQAGGILSPDHEIRNIVAAKALLWNYPVSAMAADQGCKYAWVVLQISLYWPLILACVQNVLEFLIAFLV